MKTGFYIILVAFGILTGAVIPALADSGCESQIGNCDYYLCREQKHPCGADGYFIDFSYRYCNEFETKVGKDVSQATRDWFDRVARCLQEDVEAIPVETSCSKTQTEAIAGHENCYVSTGFCEVPLEDKLKVVTTVAQQVIHPEIDETFLKILQACDARKSEVSQ
jgi:hypothetical protein